MQLYQFEKIYNEMEKEFGKVKSGNEEAHAMMLLPLEGNALKMLKGIRVKSKQKLSDRIYLYFDEINAELVSYHWTYKMDEIDLEEAAGV